MSEIRVVRETSIEVTVVEVTQSLPAKEENPYTEIREKYESQLEDSVYARAVHSLAKKRELDWDREHGH